MGFRESYVWEHGELRIVNPVEVLPIAEILAECAESGREVIVLGDIAARRIRGKVDLPSNVSVAPAHLVMPRAAGVAMVGRQRRRAAALQPARASRRTSSPAYRRAARRR